MEMEVNSKCDFINDTNDVIDDMNYNEILRHIGQVATRDGPQMTSRIFWPRTLGMLSRTNSVVKASPNP